jgi:hypothetical protein
MSKPKIEGLEAAEPEEKGPERHSLQLDPDVYQKVKAIAEKEERPVHRQLNRILRDYFSGSKTSA